MVRPSLVRRLASWVAMAVRATLLATSRVVAAIWINGRGEASGNTCGKRPDSTRTRTCDSIQPSAKCAINAHCLRLNLSVKQSRAQLVASLQQHRQVARLQFLTRYAADMGADIQRRQHLAGGVLQRHGHRAQADLQFLVDDHPALLTDLGDIRAQAFGRMDSAAGFYLQVSMFQVI